MAYDYDATYEIVKNKFMKNYGTMHLCGNCKHTFTCPRMKLQCSNKCKAKIEQLMAKYVPFATKVVIEEYIPNHNGKVYRFINVFECDKFVFEK